MKGRRSPKVLIIVEMLVYSAFLVWFLLTYLPEAIH